MSVSAAPEQGLRAWLLASAPGSRWQARCGNAYLAWLKLRGNPLAMAGLAIIVALLLVAIRRHARPHTLWPDLAHRLRLRRNRWHRSAQPDIYPRRPRHHLIIMVASLSAAPAAVGRHCGYAGGIVICADADHRCFWPFRGWFSAGHCRAGTVKRGIASSSGHLALGGARKTLALRSSDFIAAARLQGASPGRIVLRHIVPLCLSSVIIRVTLDMAGIILTAAGLGFLGLGAQPPLPEWGAMVAAGRDFILEQWWVATIPGIAIFIVSLASIWRRVARR
jgi:peptide/nickel transport system permease protein